MIDEKAFKAVAEAIAAERVKQFGAAAGLAPREVEFEYARVAILAYESAKQKEGGSDRLADLVEGMIKESPYDRWPQSRMALAIAANAVRRGRHLTSEEKMRNLVDAMEEDGPLPDHVRAGLLHDR